MGDAIRSQAAVYAPDSSPSAPSYPCGLGVDSFSLHLPQNHERAARHTNQKSCYKLFSYLFSFGEK